MDAPLESGGRFELPIPERSGAIRRARANTARVKFLRIAIVGSCSIAALLLAFIVFFDPFGKLPQNVSIGGVGLDGTRVTIDSPKITGFRKDGRPYDVRATTGYKDILKPDVTELVGVDARVGMGDASTSRITAKTGVYDAAKESVFLKGAVRIKNPSGYDMRLITATMDFNAGSLATEDPVDVYLNASTITADRMQITDNGHKISFAGHIKTITTEDDDAPAQNDSVAEAK
jgi:lipopolysaccharide export system protein LptC